MSGPHLVKKGREHRKMDLLRDFSVASPAEFVTRFGGSRVIEKVSEIKLCQSELNELSFKLHCVLFSRF